MVSDSPLHISILYGSYRSKRVGIRAALFAQSLLQKRCKCTLVDAKAYELPMLDKMYKEYKAGEAPKSMQQLHDILSDSDGYVVVSGEYNHSLPPGLKNLLDHFQSEYIFKPVGIMTYSVGAYGGVRAAVHVRAVLGELGMASISSMYAVPKIASTLDENGGASESKQEERFERFADELLWYAKALKAAREEGTPF